VLNDNTSSGVVTVTITSADSVVKWNGERLAAGILATLATPLAGRFRRDSTTFYIEAGSGNDSVLFNDTG